MTSRMTQLAWLACFLIVPSLATAQAPAEPTVTKADEATHEELRDMREVLTKAVVEGDVNAQLDRVHENVVVTWQNNRVVRGKAGLKKFLGEINDGANRVFQGYKVPPTADDLTILYGGDAAIAFGTSTPHYNLHGMEFDLENRWTATLVKDGDAWKIAAYHVSGNILDNPVLDIAKSSLYWTGGLGLLVGLAVGVIAMWLLKRRPQGA